MPKKANKPPLLDQRLVRALAHPLRVEILDLLTERVMSPKALSEKLPAPLSNVSYHVGILEENDAVELIRQAQRRGAIEHFFRATATSFVGSPDWRHVPKLFLGLVGGASLQSFTEKAIAAIRAGKFDDEGSDFTWVPIMVDPQGKEEAGKIREGAIKELLRVQERSKRRLAQAGGDGIQYLVAVAGFEAAGS